MNRVGAARPVIPYREFAERRAALEAVKETIGVSGSQNQQIVEEIIHEMDK